MTHDLDPPARGWDGATRCQRRDACRLDQQCDTYEQCLRDFPEPVTISRPALAALLQLYETWWDDVSTRQVEYDAGAEDVAATAMETTDADALDDACEAIAPHLHEIRKAMEFPS